MRDDKVAIAKGIGILLMVAVHAGMSDVMSRFIVGTVVKRIKLYKELIANVI